MGQTGRAVQEGSCLMPTLTVPTFSAWAVPGRHAVLPRTGRPPRHADTTERSENEPDRIGCSPVSLYLRCFAGRRAREAAGTAGLAGRGPGRRRYVSAGTGARS